MVDLGLRKNIGPVKLGAIAKRQQISLSQLEPLFSKLRKAHLVESMRGPGGGYVLNKPACEITVADIVSSVDYAWSEIKCCENAGCTGGGDCMTHALWSSLNECMREFLESMTLQTLIDDQIVNGNAVEISNIYTSKRGIYALPLIKSLHANTPNSIFALGDLAFSS